MENLYLIFFIIFLIVLLTIMQFLYFKILNKLKEKSKILNLIFSFIIRFWIIIHEFCHAFFAFLTWNKITKINLFTKWWWSVEIETKNYIWSLSEHWFNSNYIFKLIFNQFWLFFISFWPLIFWVWLSFFIFNIFWITNFDDFLAYDYDFLFILFLVLYSILIPSFVLSFEDIKKFFFSNQDNLGSTIVWSILNFLIFLLFLLLFWWMFINYFYFFCVIFFSLFLLQVFIYFFIEITILLFKRSNRKNKYN